MLLTPTLKVAAALQPRVTIWYYPALSLSRSTVVSSSTGKGILMCYAGMLTCLKW